MVVSSIAIPLAAPLLAEVACAEEDCVALLPSNTIVVVVSPWPSFEPVVITVVPPVVLASWTKTELLAWLCSYYWQMTNHFIVSIYHLRAFGWAIKRRKSRSDAYNGASWLR